MYSIQSNTKFTPLFPRREKCPNTEFFLVCIFLRSDWIIQSEYVNLRIQSEYRKIRIRIWTLFMLCPFLWMREWPSWIQLRKSVHIWIFLVRNQSGCIVQSVISPVIPGISETDLNLPEAYKKVCIKRWRVLLKWC